MSNSLSSKVKDLIFILGAHRSGASRLAQYVADFGYALPDYQDSIINIHQRFLTDIGSHPDDPCAFPRSAFKGKPATAARKSIQNFLEKENRSSLVIIDPCLCRLFPLWADALEPLDCDIRAIEIIRDPNDVYDSLQRKKKSHETFESEVRSREHSNLLWWRHVSEARQYIQGLECLTIAFEETDYDKAGQAELIQLFLNREMQPTKIGEKNEYPDCETSATGAPTSTDSARFLNTAYHHLLSSQTALPTPVEDIPAPPGCSDHPWPEGMYEAVSAASLKHLSGTIPHPVNGSSILINTQSGQLERPIDVLFISDKPTWPSHIYRVKNPVDAINRIGLNAIWLEPEILSSVPEILDRTHRVILHRLDWGPEFQEIVRKCRKKRIPVGYDLDDLLFLPELIASGARDAVTRLGQHEIQRWVRRSKDFQQCVSEADFFIGATESIKAAAEQFNQDCTYICNGFSPENLSIARLAGDNSKCGREQTITIGYASGTATHQADFDVVAGTIWQMMQENPELLLTIVGPLEWSTRPPAELETRITTRPLVPHVYLPFELAQFDINIVPLERNAFCDAKSPLKFFEAGLVNVPTIATGNPTYESIYSASQACLLANDLANWQDHLHRLSHDLDFRKRLGELARQTALENFHSDLSVSSYEKLPKKAEI